ncbi:hypothetical protein C1645_827057 [Glomus cerebriforme]|uniref:Uncharacterized protein n=1 Tax=Glomus cerebriforme TaxID=658196 RepID=A0A397SP29_9GLOM|nr:hypothetical protein C1645_827057 [Glomus cerebriforme]
MTTNISSLEIVTTGKSAVTDNIKRFKNNELILSMLKTKSLMKECEDNNNMNKSNFKEFDDN